MAQPGEEIEEVVLRCAGLCEEERLESDLGRRAVRKGSRRVVESSLGDLGGEVAEFDEDLDRARKAGVGCDVDRARDAAEAVEVLLIRS